MLTMYLGAAMVLSDIFFGNWVLVLIGHFWKK